MNMQSLPNLYLPRVNDYISVKYINDIFDIFLGCSLINHIDLVKKQDNKKNKYQIAFIYFKLNAQISSQHSICEKINIIEKGGEFKLLYNDYNYWIIRKYVPNLSKKLLRVIPEDYYEFPHSKVNLLTFPCYFVYETDKMKIIESNDVILICKKITYTLQEIWGVKIISMTDDGEWKCAYCNIKFNVYLYKIKTNYLVMINSIMLSNNINLYHRLYSILLENIIFY